MLFLLFFIIVLLFLISAALAIEENPIDEWGSVAFVAFIFSIWVGCWMSCKREISNVDVVNIAKVRNTQSLNIDYRAVFQDEAIDVYEMEIPYADGGGVKQSKSFVSVEHLLLERITYKQWYCGIYSWPFSSPYYRLVHKKDTREFVPDSVDLPQDILGP
jgi:hypothetical protein